MLNQATTNWIATSLSVLERTSVSPVSVIFTPDSAGVPAAFAASAAMTAATANGDVNLTVQTPDSVSFSVTHALNRDWDLLGDLTWTGWGIGSKHRFLPF